MWNYNVAEDKIEWNTRHFGSGVQTHTCYRPEKILYCHGPEDILIDDHSGTIQEWREAGGTGCLVRPGHPVILPPRIALELNLANRDLDQKHANPANPRPEYAM